MNKRTWLVKYEINEMYCFNQGTVSEVATQAQKSTAFAHCTSLIL